MSKLIFDESIGQWRIHQQSDIDYAKSVVESV